MRASFPNDIDVDYTDGEAESPDDYPTIQAKLERAIAVTKTALETYHRPAVMWTGGKDSTLTLYIMLEVAQELGVDHPPAIFIDHFQHFDELIEFVERWAKRWSVEVKYARNEDIGRYVDEHGLNPGEDIPVRALSAENRHHITEILEFEEDHFPFLLDTYVGNHLLKTVALNDTLEATSIDGVISGVRWDEQAARADETFFSPRHDPDIYPPHDRVHPILPFTERDIWEATWRYMVPDIVEGFPDAGYLPESIDDLPAGVTIDAIPVSPKYFEGFRSLGSSVSTKKQTDEPAWRQNLESTTERAGRAQDKEDLMERLRDLGYM